MGGEWISTSLGDIIELKRGYDLPQRDRRPGAVPLLSSSGMSDRHSEAKVRGPGVVTGRYGTIGKVFFVQEDFWPLNTTLYVRDFKDNDPRFVSYFLTGIDFLAYSDKAAVPRVNRNHLHEARVFFPSDVSEQKAIAHILGTLDDKIDLNRRMNETLEAMARAIFKSWFVDFDPVRAKAEGRDPGLPGHIAALFPDSFEESELGEIPKGWRVSSVGDHLLNYDSKRIPISGRERTKRKGQYPYHGAAGIMDYIDDFLFDGVFLLVGEDGSVAQEDGTAVRQYVWGKFWANNHAHVLQGKDTVSTEQLYLFFGSESVSPYVTGAVQPKLSQGRMNIMPFVFAGENVCKAFSGTVSPFFEKFRSNTDISKTLTSLRNTLLPKLISGELRIKDAERYIERAL